LTRLPARPVAFGKLEAARAAIGLSHAG